MYLPKASFLLLLIGLANPTTSFIPSHLRSAPSLLLQSGSSNDENEALVVQVQLAERKVQRLNNLLTQLERRSTQDRLDWMKERSTLTRKINILSELLRDATPPPPQPEAVHTTEALEALELELEVAREHEEELWQEQERYEREVQILQHQIVQIRNMLKTEQYRSAELEEQLDEVLEEQESERMQYQVQLEAQKREIEAMRSKLAFYEQQQQQQQPIYVVVKNETMAMS
jgi:hypothetical protein